MVILRLVSKIVLLVFIAVAPLYSATITRYVDPDAAGGCDGQSAALTTDGSGHCAYQTLQAAIYNNGQNLTDNGGDILEIICDSNGESHTADTTAVAGTSASTMTTGSGGYIYIHTPSNHRAIGSWDATKYRIEIASGTSVKLNWNYTIFEGVQVSNSGTTSTDICVKRADSRNHIKILKNILKGGNYGISGNAAGATDGDDYIYDNIVYNSYHYGIYEYAGSSTTITTIANNTVYNATSGGASSGVGIYAKGGVSGGYCYAVNNIAMNSHSGSGSLDIYVTQNGTEDYNVVSDSSGAGAHDKTGYSTYANYFTSVTEGSENFHLLDTSANLFGGFAGSDESAIFTTDIDGTTWSTWGAGADYNAGSSPPAATNHNLGLLGVGK
jgi:hypothetical protein